MSNKQQQAGQPSMLVAGLKGERAGQRIGRAEVEAAGRAAKHDSGRAQRQQGKALGCCADEERRRKQQAGQPSMFVAGLIDERDAEA